jgi:cytochrome c oxidase subunit 2
MNIAGLYIPLQSMLHPSSNEAHSIYSLFSRFNMAAFSMLGLVIVLTVYICIKYRARRGEERTPAQFKGSKKMEALMIGVPALLLIYFFYHTVVTMKAVEPTVRGNKQPDIVITGHQFWWEVYYPNTGVITANEVHMPVGKRLVMEMRTADVIHSWWVPELGNKMDLIPGRSNFLTLNINRPATYAGTCSEFCGAQHAWMRLYVVAEDSVDYAGWLAANAQPASTMRDSLAARGERIFQTATCGDCHRIQGTAAQGNEGPDLTHLFLRKRMLSGMMPLNEANLYKWVNKPQEVKPGSYMPNFIFSKDTLDALVHYMAQLK